MMSRFSFSHPVAGFIAVLVGYSSSVAIIFQAANTLGASSAEISSWLLALGVGMGLTCIGLAWHFKTPVLTAWSTPGAALLVTSLDGVSMNEAIGAFIFSSSLMTLCGVMGWFDKLTRHIPRSLASAMLAGVLLKFGMDVFISLQQQFLLVSVMAVTYFVAKHYFARYAVVHCLLVGLVVAAMQGGIAFSQIQLEFAYPVFTWPKFSLGSLIGVGLPLFIVTMASQNVPGLAVLRANGYQTPISPLITTTGVTGLLLAPFGGFAFNLAAITAAICMSPNADPDPTRRYRASIWAGCFYVIMGLFGATVVAVFAALPSALVQAIAGLALLATLGNSMSAALHDEPQRDAALVTFLVTASGLSLVGVGSAFWGLLFGMGVLRFGAR